MLASNQAHTDDSRASVNFDQPKAHRPSRMTSQGSAHGRFTRAIQRGNLRQAEMAAQELRARGALSLGDAFALCLLLAAENDRRLESALLRWHGRFELEAKSL